MGRRTRVAVIYGGRSSEHSISAVSAASVLRALDPLRYEVVSIGITPDGRWLLTDADPDSLRIDDGNLPTVRQGEPIMLPGDPTVGGLFRPDQTAGSRLLEAVDVVFPVLHGRFGEDGTIQGLLEMAGLPYVGSGVLASAVSMDKEFSKKLLAAAGLNVGRLAVVRGKDADLNTADIRALGLPLFVKPARAGSSVGITKVTDVSALADAVAYAFEHDTKVLIEAAVVGREIECGVLEGPDGRAMASLPAEIRLGPQQDWYDFEAKYLDDRCEFDIPAMLPTELTERIRDAACRSFIALDCAGLARVDFFVTDDSVIVNEVNTMPGFTPSSMYPRMWSATGIEYPELVDRLIASALR